MFSCEDDAELALSSTLDTLLGNLSDLGIHIDISDEDEIYSILGSYFLVTPEHTKIIQND